ncbi:MAG: acetyl-CoA acetyltransferase [Mycolicibacterium insubricum]
MAADARTPVLVGVGQFTERIDDDGYRARSSVELAAEAVRAALADTGAGPGAVAAAVDTVAGLRQFEICTPAPPPLGASDNYPRSVARRLGFDPARAVLEPIGGNGPQKLVTEFAGEIAAGDADVVVIMGSENGSTLRYFANREDKPEHAEHVGGQLEDRGYGYEYYMTEYTVAHGLTGAPVQYGLLDNARRARLGATVDQYRRQMAELFAPMSTVAAANPYSSSPVARTPAEIATVDEYNRMIADPYPRLLVARDQVNQGAALVLMSVAAARRLGVPEANWVYLHGHADLVEQQLLDRRHLDVSHAATGAVTEALRVAGIGLADIATFDLYSCFPFPVFAVCDGTGLATDDPRGLTLTGGLPYFGGPGNSYSLHAIAETVHRMRAQPGSFGLVGANGGIMSKYSVGIYSAAPAPWRDNDDVAIQAGIDAAPTVASVRSGAGDGVIETYSVRYDWPVRTGIIVGRTGTDDRRFLAVCTDPALVDLMSNGDPLGARIAVEFADGVNRASLY